MDMAITALVRFACERCVCEAVEFLAVANTSISIAGPISLDRPAVQSAATGIDSLERHDASDFETKTMDKLQSKRLRRNGV